MKISDFDFNLPPELIAQIPSDKRENSNLLIAEGNNFIKTRFYNILDYLEAGDLLVFNNSKVIKAKLTLAKNITINLNKKLADNSWSAFAKPARKLHIGDEFIFDTHKLIIINKHDMGEIEIRFDLDDISLFEFLDKYAEMPLPPYIKRTTTSSDNNPEEKFDNERYQTIYSDIAGSVAAPTAGLHFTKELFEKIEQKGIQIVFLTLHVGAGTFLPVKTENIEEHKMHTEYCSVSFEAAEIINKAKREKRRIIAVGTTSVRTLESSCLNDPRGIVTAGEFETNIFITPGFKFQIVDVLLTNFHFPKSTLFILICAFAGIKEMHALYKYAIEQKMRFFSYGDATLLFHKKSNNAR